MEVRGWVSSEGGARAVLADPTILQNQHLIGTLHGVEAVGNDDARAPGQEQVNGTLDL
jgi:hypothetical protein